MNELKGINKLKNNYLHKYYSYCFGHSFFNKIASMFFRLPKYYCLI